MRDYTNDESFFKLPNFRPETIKSIGLLGWLSAKKEVNAVKVHKKAVLL
jgi:hypothetical protein